MLGLQDLSLRAETNVIVETKVVQYRNMCTRWYSIHVPFILGFTTWATENVEAELGNSGCKSCEGKDLGVVGVFSTETNLSLRIIKLFKRSSDSSPTKASNAAVDRSIIPCRFSKAKASKASKRPTMAEIEAKPWSQSSSRFSDVARLQRKKINEYWNKRLWKALVCGLSQKASCSEGETLWA